MTPTAIKSLKRASTLMISCKMGQKVGNYDYKVMLLKRSAKMRVAPGFHVFPGGGIDFNDHSLNWLDVLQHKSKNLTELRNSYKSIITATSLGSLLKEDDEASREPTLPAEIAFRLCAIRETFEETGLLLAEKKRAGLKPDGRLKQWGSSYSVSELSAWQDRIRKDSSQFRAMCLELDVVPDLYGLHEWANWVTPTREKFRFNTFFFTCFLNQSPAPVDLKIDSNEIESLNFYTPEETLSKHRADEIKFIPPQLYEFNRISKFKELAQFSEFSLRCQQRGLTYWLPKFSSDGVIGLLPGDYMYDVLDNSMTADDLQAKYERDKTRSDTTELKLNRMKKLHTNEGYERNGRYEITCNFEYEII